MEVGRNVLFLENVARLCEAFGLVKVCVIWLHEEYVSATALEEYPSQNSSNDIYNFCEYDN
jgi:hypothetical protein